MSSFKLSDNFPLINNKNYNNSYNNSTGIEIEEIKIREIIEDISEIEEKIKILNNSIFENEPKLKKLEELKEIKNDLENNISKVNNNISIEIKKNDISLEQNKILINELDKKIEENKNNLLSFNTMDFKSIKLIKSIFSNKAKNGFLSKEEINNILYNENNNISNEEELKKIMKEKEINKASQNVIENNILNIKLKQEQLEENLQMLDEEKDSSNDELFDLISSKESIDCIIKLIIARLNKKNEFNLNFNESNHDEPSNPINISIDELLYFDSVKVAERICEELYNIYDLEKKNYSNSVNRSCILENKENKNRRRSYDSNLIEINNENNIKCHKRSESNNISKKENENIDNKIINNEIININTIHIKKSENNSDKKMLSKLIQNEIETFLTTQNIKNNNIEENYLNDFLYNLSIIIINKIKNILDKKGKKNIFISSNDLIIYLSYFFKSYFYEILIDNNLLFLNKDYKFIKKNIKEGNSEINKELSRLQDKLDEIKIKEKINIHMIDIIKKNNCNSDNNINENNSNLTQNEMSYLQICSEINDLLLDKEKIQNEIEKNNNYLIKKKEENKNEIIKLNNEINSINIEMENINNDIEKNKTKNNEQIINYRKIIANKFTQMKFELQSYRNKKYDNLEEYNKFCEKINNLMREKSISNYENIQKENNIINNNENTDNNIFINGNEIIINDVEKNNLEKKLLKNKKLNYNSIIGIGINGLNSNNNTKKKLNRSMTGINIHNNSINNIYNIYNNIDNNISFNNKSSIIDKKGNEILNKTSNNIYPKINQNSSKKYKIFEDNKINLNIPFNKNNHEIYNISSVSVINKNDKNKINQLNISKGLNTSKNNSSNNIKAKIKEIKKINNKISNIKGSNIPNINKIFFQSKKNSFNILNNTNSSRVLNDEQFKLNFVRNKKSSSHEKVKIPSLPFNSDNIYFKKLNPLIKNTFCYYREINLKSNETIVKYNPLKDQDLKSLCESPYNFRKSSINLSNNYNYFNVIIYNNNNSNNCLQIKIEEIENTVVSSSIKKIIEIYRNYNKCKNMKNFSFEDFINKECKLINDMNKEEIEKSALNQNYNFSLITNKGKRLEFIIFSYEEFKMWINGLAFIIKNKNEFIKKIKLI